MKPSKALVAICLSLLPIIAESNNWTLIARTESHSFHGLNGSLRTLNLDKSIPAFTISGKLVNLKTSKSSLVQWAVSVDSCINGNGKLIIADLEDNTTVETSFKRGTNTVSTIIATTMCEVGLDMLLSPKNKKRI
jgi:hypothetical protein